MAAIEIGGAVISLRKDSRSSPLLDARRSPSLPRRPRRLHMQAVMTSEPVRSASSSPFADSNALHPQTSYLSNINKAWRDSSESQLVTQEKLDHWLRDSITEIVRNIGKAPMLVHMFSHGGGESVRLESEAASGDIWRRITRRWNEENRMPDGVVLVEELDRGTEEEQTWGLLVQGRGVSCPTCYILSTCRVRSSCGFCTHFCLVRAECFGETADVQLMRAWSA